MLEIQLPRKGKINMSVPTEQRIGINIIGTIIGPMTDEKILTCAIGD